MLDSIVLLDTPKKASLQTQSTQLRAALKDFERTFAANNNARKPSKDDIKLDLIIAGKYKEYNRIRDVLAGKLSYDAFLAPPKSPARKRSHERVDSGLSWSPPQKTGHVTPKKKQQRDRDASYEESDSATPRQFYSRAIGPTPQRDGKVLGLFDMLSNSGKSSQATPSASRKRKLDEALEVNDGVRDNAVAQTPSQRKYKKEGDLLDHLTGGYGATPETGHRKHGRTPASEGRKFMLSQFFATPNAVRYSDVCTQEHDKHSTPLNDPTANPAHFEENLAHATPAYLKRSTSFKDRLRLASSPTLGDNAGPISPPLFRRGPPTLQHFRSVTRSSSQIIAEPQTLHCTDSHQHDDSDEDDLDALREIESNQVNLFVKDSQMPSYSSDYEALSNEEDERPDPPPTKVWKKKGQKRTTKRAKIRPATAKLPAAPKFVVAEDPDEDGDDEVNNEEENEEKEEEEDNTGDAGHSEYSDDESNNQGKPIAPARKPHNKSKNKPAEVEEDPSIQKAEKTAVQIGSGKNTTSTSKKKAGTINPNAHSHMNFRSLKIRNKNSKAKGAGRGRFGRR